jgi:hypothetical protein
MESEIRIEPTLHKSHGPCPHCGGEEQTVWGWVHRGRGTRAVYYVRWTAGCPGDGMVWFLCVGAWGTGSDDSARHSVGLRARILQRHPQFMVIDAADTPWGRGSDATFGSLLARGEVVDTALAEEVYGYIDRIIVEDPRVTRFLGTGEGMDGHGVPAPRRRWWQAWRKTAQRAT